MIVEPLAKPRAPKLKKTFSKTTDGTGFMINGNKSHIESPLMSPINPFLCLNEIDEYKNDQKKLKEIGDKILGALNHIRFGLINGELEKDHILNLKNTLENNRVKFKFPELQEVINDIILRCEVELAKIEFNHNKDNALEIKNQNYGSI